MNEGQAVAALSAIANPTRLRMLRMLVLAGPEGLAAGDIAAAACATPSRASFHLNALCEAGLAQANRSARNRVYRVDFDAVGALVRFLVADCCQGDARVVACCGLPLPDGGETARRAGPTSKS